MIDHDKIIEILRKKGVSENVINYAFDERNDCPLLLQLMRKLKESGGIEMDDETFAKSMTNLETLVIN